MLHEKDCQALCLYQLSNLLDTVLNIVPSCKVQGVICRVSRVSSCRKLGFYYFLYKFGCKTKVF